MRIYGTNQRTLASQARRVRRSLATIAGIVGITTGGQTSEPSVQIRTDIPAAARYGLKPGDIRRQTAVLIAGIPVGSFYHDQEIFDVIVWSTPSIRQDPTAVGNLLIDTPGGGHVPLKTIAKVTLEPSPTELDHDRASRYVDVTADVKGIGLASAIDQVSSRVVTLRYPLGYHAEVFSDLQAQQSADLDVWLAGLAALAGIFLLLQAAFWSWSRAALVFVTLPLAAVGSVLALVVTGRSLTLGVLIGLALVLALAARNSIVLLRRVQRAEEDPGETAPVDLVLAATKESAPTVLITAVGIALALLPFVVAGNVAGMEVLRPLGAAAIGGLVTSTLLTLFILPALYLRFVRAPGGTSPQAQGGS